MRRSPAFALALSLLTIAATAQQQPPPTAVIATRSIVDGAAARFFKASPGAVGLSVGIIHDGDIETANYGTLQKGTSRKPTADTLYPIASVTKTFTGTLLAQAALEGKLRLDDDIRKYLDGDYGNLEFEGHPIRLVDLLDHRSGLPFFLPDRPELSPDPANPVFWATRVSEATRNYTRANFFADLHQVRLTAIPGEKFSYSNAAAQLAGYILERVYATPYEILLRKEIVTPLGMDDTTITLNAAGRARLASGYDDRGRLTPDNPNQLQAAGAIKSTVNDMLRYLRWQLAEQDPAVRLSHRPVVESGNYAAGLNWQILHTGPNRLIWQEGNLEGFDILAIVLPERHLGVIIFANEADRLSSHNLTLMANDILKAVEPEAILLPQ